MKMGVTPLVLVVSIAFSLNCEVDAMCHDVASALGSWVGDGSAAALIKTKCVGMNRGTNSWRKGAKVRGICNSIPRSTPVATFVGKKFRGHAGIFVRCSRDGIHIYDQTPMRTLGIRMIPWRGSIVSRNAENYFVIH
ncbi:uncharacterized protein LOC100902502 [Galendromus occidentalis]|uniref:Uncharacterized protein LOC100902502 n=1 Tax=Galendromus occidentalis TaxID=34638 RepID=A0AAJ6VXT1_9ACAR|nr:uncharacterized protein LOC100902502 [Galendromus occidentalis]